MAFPFRIVPDEDEFLTPEDKELGATNPFGGIFGAVMARANRGLAPQPPQRQWPSPSAYGAGAGLTLAQKPEVAPATPPARPFNPFGGLFGTVSRATTAATQGNPALANVAPPAPPRPAPPGPEPVPGPQVDRPFVDPNHFGGDTDGGIAVPITPAASCLA